MKRNKWKKNCWICGEGIGKVYKYIFGIKGEGLAGKRVCVKCEDKVELVREYE